MSQTTTLADSLEAEVNRCLDLLAEYEATPGGAFAAAMIRTEIKRAVHAALWGDLVEMIRVHENLKTFE